MAGESANYFGLQAEDAPAVLEMTVGAYNHALGGRTSITESVYMEVNDKAEQLQELKEAIKHMIEHSNDEILIVNLVEVFHSLEEVLERHSELMETYLESLDSGSAISSHSAGSAIDFTPKASQNAQPHTTVANTTTTTTSATTTTIATTSNDSQLVSPLRSALAESQVVIQNEKAITCPICYMDTPVSQVYSFMSCDHFYCLDCLATYYKTSTSEGRILDIRCPTPQCPTLVHLEDIKAVMDSDWCSKFQDFALMAVMRLDPTCRWCPKPNCGTPVIIDIDPNDPTTKKVTCPKCSYEYCYGCGEEYHQSVSCEAWGKVKNDNDQETLKWAIGKAKRCPKCNIFIEKNEGCNHMNCEFCKHQFCWLCMGDYSDTHYSEGTCAGRQFSAEVADENNYYRNMALNAGLPLTQLNNHTFKRRAKRFLKGSSKVAKGVVVAPFVVAGVALAIPFLPVIIWGLKKMSEDE